jgi:protein-disulfide isomerase
MTDSDETQLLLTENMLTNNGSPELGNTFSDITIVEFGDYQCTFCYKFHQNTLNQINEQYIKPGQVKYIYRDFPLNGNDSILASEASYCAGEQNRYWEYHDVLYNNWAGEKTGWINSNSLTEFAVEIDLNIFEFQQCLNGHKYYQQVIDNQNYAKSIGIDATPYFLIFDDEKLVRIVGAEPFEKFQNAINQFE